MPASVRPLLAGLLLMLLSVMILAAGAASAQEAEEGGGAAVETTAPSVPEPAIPVSDEAPSQPDPEWSYRFLVPATIVLGTAAVVGAIIMYFVRVTRNRYRVIK